MIVTFLFVCGIIFAAVYNAMSHEHRLDRIEARLEELEYQTRRK
jgi:hypothetical protein